MPAALDVARTASAVLLAAALLAACATQPPQPAVETPAPPEPPPAVAPAAPEPPTREARAQAHKLALEALDQLQNGEEAAARRTLDAALALDPGSDLARKLLDQIKADAQQELGPVFFRYTVQADDSLSKLAQRFLNDRFRFYILAKYNDIANPSRLAVGQVIRIPGKEPPRVPAQPKVAKPLEPAKRPGEATDAGKRPGEATDAGRRAAEAADGGKRAAEATDGGRRAAEAADGGRRAAEATDGGRRAAEAASTRPFEALEAAPPKAKPEPPPPSEAERLYETGKAQRKAGNLEGAHRAFTDAARRDPGLADAARQRDAVRQELIARYQREANAAFHRQDLEQAIRKWDQVLQLDPGNDLARLNRARAVDLRERIQKFGK